MEKKQTKKAFILSQPESMSTKEVIEKGKAEGIELTANQVSVVRSLARTGARKKREAKKSKLASKRLKAATEKANVASEALNSPEKAPGLSVVYSAEYEAERDLLKALRKYSDAVSNTVMAKLVERLSGGRR